MYLSIYLLVYGSVVHINDIFVYCILTLLFIHDIYIYIYIIFIVYFSCTFLRCSNMADFDHGGLARPGSGYVVHLSWITWATPKLRHPVTPLLLWLNVPGRLVKKMAIAILQMLNKQRDFRLNLLADGCTRRIFICVLFYMILFMNIPLDRLNIPGPCTNNSNSWKRSNPKYL